MIAPAVITAALPSGLRQFCTAALVLLLAGCESHAGGADLTLGRSAQRLASIGVVLVVDAVPGAEMRGVKFYNESGREIYGKGVQTKRNRDILAFGPGRIPSNVRVIWRENPKTVWAKSGTDYEGTIIGDYTVDVAQRIPDDVLTDIRAHGGSLRLKFCLKPDGVLFGWDIERPDGSISKFDMPGGDFLDTRY